MLRVSSGRRKSEIHPLHLRLGGGVPDRGAAGQGFSQGNAAGRGVSSLKPVLHLANVQSKMIMNADELLKASLDGRQVQGLPWGRSPAAFVVSMQFRLVARWLPALTIYTPKTCPLVKSITKIRAK